MKLTQARTIETLKEEVEVQRRLAAANQKTASDRWDALRSMGCEQLEVGGWVNRRAEKAEATIQRFTTVGFIFVALAVVISFGILTSNRQLTGAREDIAKIQTILEKHRIESMEGKGHEIAQSESYLQFAPPSSSASVTMLPLQQRELEISLKADCWIQVRELKPVDYIWTEGVKQKGLLDPILFPPGGGLVRVQVRSGCPGMVTYGVNGQTLKPKNDSKAPDKSEVVYLDL